MTSQSSVIGNLADLGAGEILLPGFISREADGLYVDLLAVDSRGLITPFVERVFAAGARFADLDYGLFLNLLFLWNPADIDLQIDDCKRRGRESRLRLARDIVPFPEERRAIYRGIKIADGGQTAEYIFEQIAIEREIDDPAAADGSGRGKVVERLYVDFDEFVAALWEKGVRFGIDVKTVRETIARDKPERLVIATLKLPVDGKDASIAEQTDLLHRDDAPRLLPNGRMDLRHFRNRFPQVSAGTRLFKKVPRIAGHSGWDVQGREIETAPVKEFNIETLAGPGAEVVRDGGGEYVIAAMDGFLDIDAQSGQISVVDKIISREGVSMRTTGDLSLSGDEYEEHGEVQEKRVVKGRNMTFLADVFGKILSDGGRITLRQSISGGAAYSPGGSVIVEGSASRALLEARRGEVVVARAEGCCIIADRVRIERAVNCDIVADEVSIDLAEGCAIAAKRVAIKNSTARKDDPTAITLLLPDLARFERAAKAIEDERAKAAAEIAKLGAAREALAAQPEMRSYFSIQPKLKAKTLVMSAAQQVQWQSLLTRLAPTLRQVATLNAGIQEASQGIEDCARELDALAQERQAATQDASCRIEAVSGDTQVYALALSSDSKPLASLAQKELRVRLREVGAAASRLFFGNSGDFEWRPPAEGAPPSVAD